MCVGHNEQDLKNGMSIISLIKSRGFLPSCRVLQLMLWMHAETIETGALPKDFFVDIGANIGSCSVAIASIGFPTIAVEPVQQHVDAIRGSIDLNPSFNIELQHIGISSETKLIRANFAHGGRNWGSTIFEEAAASEKAESELQLRTTAQIVGNRKVSLLKIDCEGCEWAALKRYYCATGV
jgi:FkbM family methyltransferase